jgi:hypothetical protein
MQLGVVVHAYNPSTLEFIFSLLYSIPLRGNMTTYPLTNDGGWIVGWFSAWGYYE